MNNSNCQQIDLAIKLSIKGENSIKNISEGWSNAKKVFHMNTALTHELKKQIETEVPQLEYWKDEGSPHFPPDEGFFCNECKEAISFPIKK